MINRVRRNTLLTSTRWVWPTLLLIPFSVSAGCLSADDPISTDRPSVANTSDTVPKGSVQLEGGVTETRNQGIWTIDLPETRMRVGVTDCTEILADFPDYYRSSTTGANQGTTNPGLAIKHQFPDWVDGLTLLGTIGVLLDTGDAAIAGAGSNAYAQVPWSYDFGNSWSINGMFSTLEQRHAPNTNSIYVSTLYLDRVVNDKSDMFVEFANNDQKEVASVNTWGLGGAYRITQMQQFDFKVGSGLNKAGPGFYMTIGYSVRLNRLF